MKLDLLKKEIIIGCVNFEIGCVLAQGMRSYGWGAPTVFSDMAYIISLTCAHEDAGSDRGNGMQASCYARGAHANY